MAQSPQWVQDFKQGIFDSLDFYVEILLSSENIWSEEFEDDVIPKIRNLYDLNLHDARSYLKQWREQHEDNN